MNDTLLQQTLAQATIHINERHPDKAIPLLLTVLHHRPHDADIAFRAATAFRQCGLYDDAARYYAQAAENKPDFFAALCNLGATQRELGNVNEAISTLQKALLLRPDSIEALCNCAMAYSSAAQPHEALACYKRAIDLKPFQTFQRVQYAEVALTLGARDDACAILTAGLSYATSNETLYLALGKCAKADNNSDLARKHFIAALTSNPELAAAHFELGTIMRDWKLLDEAIICYRNALRFSPDDIYSIINLGEVLQRAGCTDESEKLFKTALLKDQTCTIAHDNLLVSMNYNSSYSPEQIIEAHSAWGSAQCLTVPRNTVPHASLSDRKIRIGYCSPDFCNHPAGAFLLPMLLHQNRTDFEIFCYAHTLHDDHRTAHFKSLASHWLQVEQLTNAALADRIRHDGIDILVDTAGHFTGNRLAVFAMKPAPIQISAIGYPGPTGCIGIDYRISDFIIDPPELDHVLPDTPLRIPGGFCCYHPPEALPPVAPLPALQNGYVTFGSLHTTARLNATAIELWSSVLHAVPDSRMFICRDTLTSNTIARLAALFTSHNIDISRVTFRSTIPEEGHLHLYDGIDISLDTTPWSGHTTACESLVMGVPVITLLGDRHAGRMVASVLQAAEKSDWIAQNRATFITIAQALSANISALSSTRGALRDNLLQSPLCDGATYMAHLETNYRSLLTTHTPV